MSNIKDKIIDLKIRNKKCCVIAVYTSEWSSDDFLNKLAECLNNGADFIELSANNVSDREFIDVAKKSKQLCAMFGATIIIKSRVDIALLSLADGVNLNEDDMDIQSAKKIIGEESIIGITTTNTQAITRYSVKGGADYIMTICSTPTEPVISTGLEYAKWVSENTSSPVFVTGTSFSISHLLVDECLSSKILTLSNTFSPFTVAVNLSVIYGV